MEEINKILNLVYSLEKKVSQLEEENAELKAQIAEPDTTTTTNNKNDSKLTAVGAD